MPRFVPSPEVQKVKDKLEAAGFSPEEVNVRGKRIQKMKDYHTYMAYVGVNIFFKIPLKEIYRRTADLLRGGFNVDHYMKGQELIDIKVTETPDGEEGILTIKQVTSKEAKS
jgi:hypothetical protein